MVKKKTIKKKLIKKITQKVQKKLDRREDRKKLKEWSINVKKDWGNKCAICEKIEYLNSHHIIPRQIKEFKYNLINGICLCPGHHKFSFICSPHHNPLVFFKVMNEKYPKRMARVNDLLNNMNSINTDEEERKKGESKS